MKTPVPSNQQCQQLWRQAYDQPGEKIFLQGEQIVSYAQLRDRLELAAGLFAGRGLQEGDRVLLAVSSPAYFAELFIALISNGYVPVPVDPAATGYEARVLAQQVQPRLSIIDETLGTKWSIDDVCVLPPLLVATGNPPKTNLLTRLLGARSPEPDAGSAAMYPDVLTQFAPQSPVSSRPHSATAYIVPTSGSTADPRLVQVSWRAIMNTLRSRTRRYELTPESRILNVLSTAHGDGFGGPLLAFFNGATLIRPSEFSPAELPLILDAIYTWRATHFIGVPAMFRLMLRLGEQYQDAFSTPDFKRIVSVAAALSEDLWSEFEQYFGVELCNDYSLAECSSALFSGISADGRLVGSLGKPADCEARVQVESAERAQNAQTGELCLRGDSVMTGYLNNTEANRLSLVEGWFHTGDLVTIDAKGFIHLVGRKKEQINFLGNTIWPAEVIEVLESHPGVIEAAVIGVDSAQWGEVPVALLVMARGATLDSPALSDFCRTRLSEFKLPREFHCVDELPRSASGKLRAAQLRALYAAINTPASDASRCDVVDIARRCFRTDLELGMNDNANSVPGWDSLAHMELILAVERQFSLRFTAAEIMRIEKLGDLVDLVEQKHQPAHT